MKRLLVAFLAVRLVLALLAMLNGALPYDLRYAPPHEAEGFRYRLAPMRTVDAFVRWDGRDYVHIAYLGYDNAQEIRSNTAFFPGYPWLVRGVHRGLVRPLLPESVSEAPETLLLTAHLVATAAALVALTLLFRWLRRRHGEAVALRGGLLFVMAPHAFVFSATHSEGTFLALMLAAFLSAERGRAAGALLATALASCVRLFGVLAAPSLALILIRREGGSPLRLGLRWLLFALPLLGVGIVLLRMAEVNGDALAYFRQQRRFFGHAGFPELAGVLEIFDVRGKDLWTGLRDLLQAAYLGLALFGVWALARDRRPDRWALLLLVGLLVGVPLLSGDVISLPRYVAVAFPLYGVFAERLGDGRRFRAALVLCGALQALLWLGWIHAWPVLI